MTNLLAAAFVKQGELRCHGARVSRVHSQCRREGKKWWWAALGGLILIGCAAFLDASAC